MSTASWSENACTGCTGYDMHEHAEMDGQVKNIMAPAADRMGGGWVLVIESTHTHTLLTALFWDYPGEPVPERKNQSGLYRSKRQ